MKDRVLLLARRCEPARDKLSAELRRRGASVALLRPEELPSLVSMSAELGACADRVWFRGPDARFGLDEVRSVWYGTRERPLLPAGLDPAARALRESETGAALDCALAAADVFWVNDPFRVEACSKLLQLRVARELGLRVPKTLLANDPGSARRFYEECAGEIVYKPLETMIWKHSTGSIFTSKVPRERLWGADEILRRCPCLLQEYVEKSLELRVTVIGRRVFAAALHSQESERGRVDWRMDIDAIRYEPYALPGAAEAALRAMLDRLGLNYGAFDLILTPGGELVFLEVNAQGQFGWIERRTGMPLYAAMAELLMAGRLEGR